MRISFYFPHFTVDGGTESNVVHTIIYSRFSKRDQRYISWKNLSSLSNLHKLFYAETVSLNCMIGIGQISVYPKTQIDIQKGIYPSMDEPFKSMPCGERGSQLAKIDALIKNVTDSLEENWRSAGSSTMPETIETTTQKSGMNDVVTTHKSTAVANEKFSLSEKNFVNTTFLFKTLL